MLLLLFLLIRSLLSGLPVNVGMVDIQCVDKHVVGGYVGNVWLVVWCVFVLCV